MSNSNGKITAPVNMTDIATVLGKTGVLIDGSEANKWAKNKPFETYNNPRIEQTASDREQGAYGFYWWNMTKESSAPIASTAYDCMQKAAANAGTWLRKPPTIVRMGDFDGYNHNAVQPYLLNAPTNGSKTISQRVYVDPYDSNAEIRVSDMPDLAQTTGADVSALKIGVLYRKKGLTTMYLKFSDEGFTMADIDNGSAGQDWSITFSLPVSSSDTGTLTGETVMVATDADSVDDTGTWIYIPDTYRVITYAAVSGLLVTYDSDGNGTGLILNDSSGNFINDDSSEVDSLTLVMTMKNDQAYAVNYEYYVYLYGTDGWSSREIIYSGAGQLAANESVDYMDDFLGTTINVQTAIQSNEFLPSTLYIAMDVSSYRVGNPASTAVIRHFDFMNNTLKDNEAQGGDRLLEIIQKYPNM